MQEVMGVREGAEEGSDRREEKDKWITRITESILPDIFSFSNLRQWLCYRLDVPEFDSRGSNLFCATYRAVLAPIQPPI